MMSCLEGERERERGAFEAERQAIEEAWATHMEVLSLNPEPWTLDRERECERGAFEAERQAIEEAWAIHMEVRFDSISPSFDHPPPT